MPRIYLAGPIAGKTWQQATDWRSTTEALLNTGHTAVQCFSPLRGNATFAKMALAFPEQPLDGMVAASGPTAILTQRAAIMARDYQDCIKADCILANLLSDEGSLGTAMELGWAWANHIPVVALVRVGKAHPMIDTAISHRIEAVPAGEDAALVLACQVVRSIVLP